MKKTFIFFLLLLIFAIAIFSYDLTLVSEKESNYLATNWLCYINKIPLEKKLGKYQIKFIEQINYRQHPLCVIYHLNPRGYILIPLYKEYPPIKSFSVISNFDPNSKGYEFAVLEEMKTVFDFLEKYKFGESEELEKELSLNCRQWNKLIQIELKEAYLEKSDLLPENRKNDQRKLILKNYSGEKLETIKASPLLNTTWDQSWPFNNWCPSLGGKKCYVGCVATAMAQIMRYYKWPPKGNGSHSYYWSKGSRTLSANFNDSYDWNYMPTVWWKCDTDREQDAVAELCYEAGVSVDMNYGTDGSSASTSDVAYALKTYFKYSDDIQVIWRNDYNNVNNFFNKLKSQRDLSRPIEFAMYSNDSGHAVVIDGYLITNGLNQVHINMGWGGYYDAYYTLDSILDYTDTYWQHAVINIFPAPKDQPPSISITSLQNGDVVNKTTIIKANATDDKGITKVEFYIDNALKATDTSQPYEWSWDTTKYTSGTHYIKAKAYDTINQTAEHTIQVTVDQPPNISITSPASGSNVHGLIIIKTSASDDFGIKKVEFYVNNGLSKTKTESPYILRWGTNKILNGKYSIKAVVYDTRNQTSQHKIVLIRIPHAPLNFSGTKQNNSSVLLEEYLIALTWQSNNLNKGISKYRIYNKEGKKWILLGEVNADTFKYWHRNISKDEKYTYAIKAVDNKNNEGESIYLVVQ